jgi:hypothetical protein
MNPAVATAFAHQPVEIAVGPRNKSVKADAHEDRALRHNMVVFHAISFQLVARVAGIVVVNPAGCNKRDDHHAKERRHDKAQQPPPAPASRSESAVCRRLIFWSAHVK